MKPGDELPPTLEREIRKRKYYLLLLSQHSAASQWVTYEWGVAKGAECNVRMLRFESGVVIPPPLSSVVAGDDLGQEVLYYINQKYDRLSLQVFLRDLLRPLTICVAANFRSASGHSSRWEHPNVASWPEEDRELRFKEQFDLVKDPAPPRVASIEVQFNENPPRLVLQCQRERPSN
jgi:hypothetical protein